MAPKKAAAASGKKTTAKKKRTAHVDDASKPGTVLNVATNLLIATKSVIAEFCEEKEELGRRSFKLTDTYNTKVDLKVTKQHLHLKAANAAYALRQMEDEELHEYLFHFLFYVKDLGLLERAKKQEEMFSAGETGPSPSGKAANGNGKHQDDDSGGEDDDAEASGEAPDSSSATERFGAAARDVAEAAGADLKQ
jgi:hypothetical protein